MKKSQAAKRRERLRKQANKAMNIVIMIPALNPDEKLTNYVRQLATENFREIVVINDGSSQKSDGIFDEIAAMEHCTVLRHEVNRGKGRALKTGMEYVLKHSPDCTGIVTGDADGQHRLKDTLRVAKELIRDDSRLVLGARNFNSKNIPARSSFGNKVTSWVFAFMFGQKLMDTQTGLRGIPLTIVPSMLKISGERFEYEMNMLIECRRQRIGIYEIPIDTVYIDENSSSHFNPVIDSIKIYWLIFRSFFSFIFTSVGCTLLDLLLFTLLARLVIPSDFRYRILLATAVARVISATVNFIVNKNVVFHKKGHIVSSAVKYFCLAVVQMLISAKSVEFFAGLLGWHETIVKAIVDTILFIFNYFIQKKFVFKK
ncbi:MAG: bifunctional glycosyltransferase family 2/GtrA family protein [Clostridia bacterium]|nr:bifunctional glycosyltransferase family 2/GtrA family protein [Clostridia bacterium]